MATRRVLIVGGVAGGASVATRLRRLDEQADIVIFERGAHVSFANCGLPYHVGDVIEDEAALLVASRGMFRDRFNIDVRVQHEVLSIDRENKRISVRNLREDTIKDEVYDVLVLAPGAAPIEPPNTALPGVFVVRNIPDAQKIRAWLGQTPRHHAVVVGGGFIGIEMAENLHKRGLAVTVLEKLPQPLPPLDPEMAAYVTEHLKANGVEMRLGEGLAGITLAGARLQVKTDHERTLTTDLVVLALGVRPETRLAARAGLSLNERGAIVVDGQMRTSDPQIFAVGDAVETFDYVRGERAQLALAGPANRQGRIAAASIAGRRTQFRGVQGTAIVGAMGLVAASTGASEKSLRRAGVTDFEVVYLHPSHHAGYYPGAQPMHLKLIFSPTGCILGAQAVGGDGVDKRIDVIATTIQNGGDVHTLAEAELCYAPQFGAAKDPVNVAGMVAENVLDGDAPLADWSELSTTSAMLIDVREPHELASGTIEGARLMPLSTLRLHLGDLPRDREIWIFCAAGQRGYFAQRLLRQWGYDAKNLSGGFKTYLALEKAKR